MYVCVYAHTYTIHVCAVLFLDSLSSEPPGNSPSNRHEVIFHCGFNIHFPYDGDNHLLM